MSANLIRLRKRAAELEQKKQFDRALEVYVQILDEGGKDLDDEDVPLFNRVGDMLMRKGSVTEALGYYERAVDMYAERGYLNNAIALCNKILRQSPGRAAVYYKLARISAKKGFKSDARKNFLEYADRMQKLGMADEAFRALKEFASLYPDQDDVRLVLAELLSKENRKGEAIEQLQSLYEKLQSEGRAAEARATIDRMRAIDPSVTPREGRSQPTPAAVGDLIFLDLNDADGPEGTKERQPASARAPVASPVPALTGLSITFFPDEPEPAAPHPEGFESTALEEPEPVEKTQVTRSLTPLGSELVVESVPIESSPRDPEPAAPLDLMTKEPEHIERVEHLLEELLPESASETRAPSRTPPPLSSFEFADIELDDVPQEQAGRDHDLTLPGELPDVREGYMAPVPSLESDAAAEDARAAAEEAADLAADIAAREAGSPSIPADWAPPPPPKLTDEPEPEEVFPATPDPVLEGRLDSEPLADIPDDFLSMPAGFGGATEPPEEHAFPPLPGLDDAEPAASEPVAEEPEPVPVAQEPEPVPVAPTATPLATISIGSAESHLRGRLELEPENWELRRQLGEALLDTGDREGGLYELELAMTGFELRGLNEWAQEVVDVILKVNPASISHHQKRVEYAVRSRNRGRLTHAYLELADALFRSGAADKAVAVYSRVLELDASNERAEFALATLAPEELVRLRGGPARPERWTDELAAIRSDGKPAEATLVVPAPPDEQTNGAPFAEQTPTAPHKSDRVRFGSLELPVPDWGEGVPSHRAAARAPAEESAPGAPAEVSAASAPEVEAPPPETSHESDRGVEVEPLVARNAADDHAPYEDLSSLTEPEPERDVEPAGTPPEARMPSGASSRIPTPRVVPESPRLTPDEVPVARSATPLSSEAPHMATPDPVPAYREPTPIPVTTTRSVTPYAVPAPRIEQTQGDADSGFIDLGEWLRNTEPVRSTRMQVEDPRPTGDEQADFEEMLRRFKRGVAENVEAEDYEAHYDLGVAYKEMGLIDEAIAQFQKALRDPGQRVRSYEALGQCFVEKAQYPIAAALLQRACEVPGSDDQQLVGVLYLLGFATEHLGRPADALPYYLRVFAVDIEFRDVAERVAALGKLTK